MPFGSIFVACAGWERQISEKLKNTGFVLLFIPQRSTCTLEVLFLFFYVIKCVRTCAHVIVPREQCSNVRACVCIFFPLFSHRDPAQSCSSPLPACRYHSIHRSLCHCTFLHPPYLQQLLPTLLLHLHCGFIHVLMSNFH